ncbi:MAG: MBL fold metallo-hydrolase [Proteobacteria bacterium]|nr:MBL fold metallo-hydrolase [Pseudomonadota bacterium]MBU1398586.1 MBL fold metallo-hydrolase [Pseudomonadota bacterium]MBU1570161.1 MBL fold metallo-hydrolase [Pseudomonadota bacterium]
MNIKQFRYSSDNLGYLLYAEKSAIAIDGGAVDQIFSFAGQNDLKIEYVTNTHSHPDHTMGLKSLLTKTGAVYLDHNLLPAKGFIGLDGEKIDVYHTPGHTDDSVTFHVGNFLVTGDTLFNGTVGNCFSGDLFAFYNSIKMLITFPKDTVVYAGHDYVEYSMAFAGIVEPGNVDINFFLKKYNPEHVSSTIEDELKVNPYLRFNDSKMISVLKAKGLPVSTEFERWESLMSLG